jgi:hypothetical protein
MNLITQLILPLDTLSPETIGSVSTLTENAYDIDE